MLQQICRITGQPFTITDEDITFYKKMGVITDDDMRGLPTLCPEERQRRRLAWRNERNLYHRTCDGTGKKIVSIYPENTVFPVYERSYWWSDKWDPMNYGRDFDFSKSFFEQFHRLIQKVPRLSIINKQAENSEFNNYSKGNKNCYLTFGMHFNEDALYSHYGTKNKNICDCFRVSESELVYECIDCQNCYNCAYLQDSKNCHNSAFLKNCIGCDYCFGSVNLRNKKYYFNNNSLTKNEYFKKIKEITFEKKFQKKFFEFTKKFPHLYMEGIINERSSGNYLSYTKNLIECFDSDNCEDCQFGSQMDNTKFSKDINCMGYETSELCYMTIGCSGLYTCMLSDSCWNNSDILYSNLCFSSKNLFGCIGLKNSQYCILNKQYTKEEYEKLVPQIIEHMKQSGEWGEFFPMDMSPFGYNETVAQEYFPLEEPVVNSHGCSLQYNWAPEKQSAKYSGPKYEIPDDIKDIPDEILDKILTCEVSGKHYRIIKPELEFYRTMNLPIPRLCPDERHKARMKLRNPRKLWKRNCDNCSKEMETTFAPDRPEKVFCEECYLQEVN